MNSNDKEHKPNPYPLRDGKPRMRQSVAAFFDILGFSEMCKDESAANDLLPQIWEVLNKARPILGDEDEKGLYAIRSLTDNIVFGWPYTDDRDSEFQLGVTMMTLARYQLELTLNGFFVRGGIDIGPIYIDESVAFGPALIMAHDLESKHAVYPRIILSHRAAEAARTHADFYTELLEAPQQKELLTTPNEFSFVNYLEGSMPDESPESLAWLRPKIQMHREVVQEKLSAYRGNDRIWRKYAWVAQYHNYVCGYLYPQEQDLSIESKDLPPVSLDRFISEAEAEQKRARIEAQNREAAKIFEKYQTNK